jgi:hypothetical protein
MNKNERPFFHRLPQTAKDFIDQKLTEQKVRGEAEENLEVREAMQLIEALLEEMGAPKYTLDLFRDMHRYTYKEDSITWLHLSDSILLDLLNQEIYFANQLEERLKSRSVQLTLFKSPEEVEEVFRILHEQLDKWRAFKQLPLTERRNNRFPSEDNMPQHPYYGKDLN